MAILRYIIPFALTLLLTGCYETFDPDIKSEPVLCINSLIMAGEPVEVQVTRSWTFNDKNGVRDHSVDDAIVSVYANGIWQTDDYLPQEGDDIRIVAESKKYGKAEAAVKVPHAVPIADLKFKPETVRTVKHRDKYLFADVYFNYQALLRINDIYPTDDYFRLGYRVITPESEEASVCSGNGARNGSDEPYIWFWPGNFDYEAEPILKEHIGVFESMFGDYDEPLMVFTDKQFSGKSYTMNLNFQSAYYRVYVPENTPGIYDYNIVFMLFTVSPSYYNRAIYVWQAELGMLGDLGDLGFADPIWGYSNVSTGAGVVAAVSGSFFRVSLSEFLQKEVASAPVYE